MQLRQLTDRIDAALPQTQCTRCGEPDCRRYAQAIAEDRAPINRCPPGGQAGVARLAQITQRPSLPLDPQHGIEAERGVALIDETWCIGCTLCIKACPVDAIIGAPKQMHVVIAADCTGCELCIPVCPVDCIELPAVTSGQTGWAAWSSEQAQQASHRYQTRSQRLERDAHELQQRLAAKAPSKPTGPQVELQGAESTQSEHKRAVIAAAIARARVKAQA